MFRLRQSSLVGAALSDALGGGCGHRGPNAVALRVSVHRAGGSGGRHLRRPTGAAAYGMPLNATTSVPEPLTGPSCVATVVSWPWVSSENAARHVSTAQSACFSMVIGTCFDGAPVSRDYRRSSWPSRAPSRPASIATFCDIDRSSQHRIVAAENAAFQFRGDSGGAL
jgi:hypothetical protein